MHDRVSPYLSLYIATPQQLINNQQRSMCPVITAQLLLTPQNLIIWLLYLIKALLKARKYTLASLENSLPNLKNTFDFMSTEFTECKVFDVIMALTL